MSDYVHELTRAEWRSLEKSGRTYGYLIDNFREPPWCGAGRDALGAYGCWSLISTRTIKNEQDCKQCDFYRLAKEVSQ